MDLLIFKHSKILYQFFAFNSSYIIYGSYAVWQFLRNNNNVAHDTNRDYIIYMNTFKVNCDTQEDMLTAFHFIKWYFRDIDVVVDRECSRFVIWIDSIMNITLSVNQRMILDASDLLYIDNGVV